MRDDGARSRDGLGWHGPRICGSGDDHALGEWEQHFSHFRNSFVPHHTVHNPDPAPVVKPLDVAGECAGSGRIVSAVENYFGPLRYALEPAGPPGRRDA